MLSGYTGNLLCFDLDTKTFIKEELPHELLKKWLGGTGLGVKYMYEEVPPDTSWDDPANILVIATGPLAGTAVKGSGTYSVVTKGPMTGGLASSQANGFMGAFLKFCGYQGLIVQGQASEWVYLYIDEDKVEIKSAEHLVGLDTIQTQEALQKEYNSKPTRISISCIGPAAENQVKFSCLVGDHGHVAAHNGIGTVLGSKKVKAIVVKRGSKGVAVSNKDKLREIAGKIHDATLNTPAGLDTSKWGTNVAHPILHKMGGLPVKNLTTSIFPDFVKYDGEALRNQFAYKKRPCWGCNWDHCGTLTVKSGPFAGFTTEEPEYEAMAAMGPLIGINDPTLSLMLADHIDRLGMDCNETGWMVAWIMECYEKGYLTADDLDGLEMNWGNFENTKKFIWKMAHREGFCDRLSGGVKKAAEAMGSPAYECAVFTGKANTPRSHDHRAIWNEYLDTCVSNTGTIETTGGGINVKQHGLEPISDPFSWEQVARQNAVLSGRRVMEDSLGICRLPAAEDIFLTAEALTAATGDPFTAEELMTIGKRIVNLMRLYNYHTGLTADKDKPSPRYSSSPVDGPAAGQNVAEAFRKMKDRYYELMGWDKETGKPLPETLKKLGLSELIKWAP
ncbi:MAG: aldehyde ferredoxin oxidoreductase C-terminal domain-containing protein [Bacillota bacterium]|nr:aldehyde ferredoxin oxidoreductase C-terminal domain-containing protein [Bacillota bacterium]